MKIGLFEVVATIHFLLFAIKSALDTGNYKLMEKMKGTNTIEGMTDREWYDTYKAYDRNTNGIVIMVKMKNGSDMERIESSIVKLKECDGKYLMRYLDVIKMENELWVFIPARVDRIDCNGVWWLLLPLPIPGK